MLLKHSYVVLIFCPNQFPLFRLKVTLSKKTLKGNKQYTPSKKPLKPLTSGTPASDDIERGDEDKNGSDDEKDSDDDERSQEFDTTREDVDDADADAESDVSRDPWFLLTVCV